MKKISLVFLPQHLQATFNSVKINLDDLDLLSTEIELNKEHYDQTYYSREFSKSTVFNHPEDLSNFFKNKVSLQDITDFIVINKYLTKKLFKSHSVDNYVVDNLIDSGIVNYDKTTGTYKQYNELLSMYHNSDILINENNLDQVFSFVKKDNCIFIILKNGFSNLITLNREDLQKSFITLIFDQMIKTYGEQTVYETGLLVNHLESL